MQGFSSSLDSFRQDTKEKINSVEFDLQRVKQAAMDLLGDDVDLIEDINFDPEARVFYDVSAPPSVLEKLRIAGLLRDDACSKSDD